jgi:hypothetical protein
MHRRETIIALRARRHAYRVATDIEHPPLQVPSLPTPAVPQWGVRSGTVRDLEWVSKLVREAEMEYERAERRRDRIPGIVIRLWLMLGLSFLLWAVFVEKGKPSPPPQTSPVQTSPR